MEFVSRSPGENERCFDRSHLLVDFGERDLRGNEERKCVSEIVVEQVTNVEDFRGRHANTRAALRARVSYGPGALALVGLSTLGLKMEVKTLNLAEHVGQVAWSIEHQGAAPRTRLLIL